MTLSIADYVATTAYASLREALKTLPLLLSLAGAVAYAAMIATIALTTHWPYDRTPTEAELLLMRMLTVGGWVVALVALSASCVLGIRGIGSVERCRRDPAR